MSKYVHKSHNVSVLIYHIVCPAKSRKVVCSEEVDNEFKDVCLEIAKRYELLFLEIGTDQDQLHFLVQSVPSYSPTKIVKTIKSMAFRFTQALPMRGAHTWPPSGSSKPPGLPLNRKVLTVSINALFFDDIIKKYNNVDKKINLIYF